jgi:hypothetical protein
MSSEDRVDADTVCLCLQILLKLVWMASKHIMCPEKREDAGSKIQLGRNANQSGFMSAFIERGWIGAFRADLQLQVA